MLLLNAGNKRFDRLFIGVNKNYQFTARQRIPYMMGSMGGTMGLPLEIYCGSNEIYVWYLVSP